MKRIFHYTIQGKDQNKTIAAYLKGLGYSRHVTAHLKRQENGIRVNDVWTYANYQLKSNDLLTVTLAETESSEHIVPVDMPLHIVYEDEDILVLNKPADTPIHPSVNNFDNTLANGIAHYYKEQGQAFVYRCINRLDRDTTGLLIIAKHMLSACILSTMVAERAIHREYLAIAQGKVPDHGVINAPIARKENSAIERCVDFAGGDRAVTHFERISYQNGCSLVSLKLETGRTHQIRVHMSYLGFPLIGDYLYCPDYRFISRQALHSHCLEFQHPITKQLLAFEAELPEDMQRIVNKSLGMK